MSKKSKVRRNEEAEETTMETTEQRVAKQSPEVQKLYNEFLAQEKAKREKLASMGVRPESVSVLKPETIAWAATQITLVATEVEEVAWNEYGIFVDPLHAAAIALSCCGDEWRELREKAREKAWAKIRAGREVGRTEAARQDADGRDERMKDVRG